MTNTTVISGMDSENKYRSRACEEHVIVVDAANIAKSMGIIRDVEIRYYSGHKKIKSVSLPGGIKSYVRDSKAR